MTVGTDNLVSMVAPASVLVLLALAVRQDLVHNRISNLLTFGGLAAGLFLALLMQGPEGAMFALAGAAIGLTCLLPLYLCKGMGAGDVKLMAAAGAFLGPFNAFAAAMLSLAAGAILGIAILAFRIIELRGTSGALASGPVLARIGKERFPYAAAIAVGVVATLWLRGLPGGLG